MTAFVIRPHGISSFLLGHRGNISISWGTQMSSGFLMWRFMSERPQLPRMMEISACIRDPPTPERLDESAFTSCPLMSENRVRSSGSLNHGPLWGWRHWRDPTQLPPLTQVHVEILASAIITVLMEVWLLLSNVPVIFPDINEGRDQWSLLGSVSLNVSILG